MSCSRRAPRSRPLIFSFSRSLLFSFYLCFSSGLSLSLLFPHPRRSRAVESAGKERRSRRRERNAFCSGSSTVLPRTHRRSRHVGTSRLFYTHLHARIRGSYVVHVRAFVCARARICVCTGNLWAPGFVGARRDGRSIFIESQNSLCTSPWRGANATSSYTTFTRRSFLSLSPSSSTTRRLPSPLYLRALSGKLELGGGGFIHSQDEGRFGRRV